MLMRRFLLVMAMGLLATGCATYEEAYAPKPPATTAKAASNFDAGLAMAGQARIEVAAKPLQCVPYARDLSGINIRGNAWTWWKSAKGSYHQSRTPSVGSVLVMAKTKRLRLGHLAVVTEKLNEREIVVRHANWLNQGRIHLDTPVRDVSPNKDWSAVRVWYTPGQTYGGNTYAVSGFILPERLEAKVAF